MQINLRSLSAQIIKDVIDHKQFLNLLLTKAKNKFSLSNKEHSLVQEICFGVMRLMPYLELLINKFMHHKFSGKNRILHYLLMVGIYQLLYCTQIPCYAIISETVEGASIFDRKKLKPVINAILRKCQRKQLLLNYSVNENQESLTYHLHPDWLFNYIKLSWPNDYKNIIEANNQHPPMWLRINRQYNSCNEWLKLLQQTNNNDAYFSKEVPGALRLLQPISIDDLPGFHNGWVTVQDLSAQRAVFFLDPHDNEDILDVCAAPGIKTTHILEIAPKANITAVDISYNRILKLKENLTRLKMHAKIIQGNGCKPYEWCDKNKFFDRILLDVPCSCTGIIRRHPDIKWIRSKEDIKRLIIIQRKLLNAIWNLLNIGGTFIYSTCSILPEENQLQIQLFLKNHSNAKIEKISNTNDDIGLQILPKKNEGDGFFYSKLIKIHNSKI